MEVMLSGASFLGHLDGFGIGVAGDYADFWLDGGHDPPVVEQVNANTYVAFSGNATATIGIGAPTISTSLDGWIEYCVTDVPPLGKSGTIDYYDCAFGPVATRRICESKNHQLILKR